VTPGAARKCGESKVEVDMRPQHWFAGAAARHGGTWTGELGNEDDDFLFGEGGDDDLDGGDGTDECDQDSGAGTLVDCELV
jgi:hypothetical protein